MFRYPETTSSTSAQKPGRRIRGRVRRNGNGKPKRPSPKTTETLAELIKRSSLAERIEAARELGVDVIWDTMVSPVIE